MANRMRQYNISSCHYHLFSSTNISDFEEEKKTAFYATYSAPKRDNVYSQTCLSGHLSIAANLPIAAIKHDPLQRKTME